VRHSAADMADLTVLEKRRLEKLLRMEGGYVLGFSNNTFDTFVIDSVHRSIYDEKYSYGSGSKANQMRGFWREESNAIVAKLLSDLMDYIENEGLERDAQLTEDCRAMVSRLREGSPVAELDALAQIGDERDLEVVARAAREAIDRNEPVTGLDRLHTFTVKFLRSLCRERGLTVDRSKPLHSIFGEYVRNLHERGHIESKMTASILKAMHGPLEAFNQVRNEHSLAHDNPLLNHDEALLVYNHVTSCLRFVRDLEKRLQRQAARQAARADDDIPF